MYCRASGRKEEITYDGQYYQIPRREVLPKPGDGQSRQP